MASLFISLQTYQSYYEYFIYFPITGPHLVGADFFGNGIAFKNLIKITHQDENFTYIAFSIFGKI
jgi:hypothetical protein